MMKTKRFFGLTIGLFVIFGGLLTACGNDTSPTANPTVITSTAPATQPPAVTATIATTPTNNPVVTTTRPATAVPTLTTAAASAQPNQPTAQPAQSVSFFEERTDAVNLLKSFYNAINRKEYRRAYDYWSQPGRGVDGQPGPFAQFAQGYANTVSVKLITGTTSGDAGAGQLYTSIPTVLVATQTNGSTISYYGCYVTHRTNTGIDPNPDNSRLWKLERGTIQVAPANAQTDALLAQGCKQS